jgi:hypothetical protein
MRTETRRESRCVWIAPSEDPDARYLVPGCWERVTDWNAPCACKTTAEELAEAEATAQRLERELQRLRDDHHALVSAVGKHQDGSALLQQADKTASAWRAARARTEAQERSQ